VSSVSLRAGLVVLAMMGLMLALLWAMQRHLIYLPSRTTVPPAAEILERARDVRLQTSDGLAIGAWFIPSAAHGEGVTVLVANGNAGDRSLRAPLAQALADRGLGVLLFDYRGYGGNPGRPSEEGLGRDVRAAYRFLVDQERVPPGRLLYFGESLGAAVMTELAVKHPPGGMVLRSPFVDLASVGRVHYPFLPVRTLLRDRYPLAEQLAKIDVPTTVVYGTEDSIVPPVQSRAVAEAARGLVRLVAVEGANHTDLSLLDGAELVNAVVDLATQVGEAHGRTA